MGYYPIVFVVFGIELDKKQYQQLMQEFFPELFINVGTGKDPDGEKWQHCFTDIDDEIMTIMCEYDKIGCGFSETTRIPNTEYYLLPVDIGEDWRGGYMALHVHIHYDIMYTNPAKKVQVPNHQEIETFMSFAKPILEKYAIKSEYHVVTITQ